jgi:hypothetical protein
MHNTNFHLRIISATNSFSLEATVLASFPGPFASSGRENGDGAHLIGFFAPLGMTIGGTRRFSRPG